MGDSLFNKLLKRVSGGNTFEVGDRLTVNVDHCYVHSGSAGLFFKQFDRLKTEESNSDKVSVSIDRDVPCNDSFIAREHAKIRKRCDAGGIQLFDEGSGISHWNMIDSGSVKPGQVVIGAESYSGMLSPLNGLSFALGVTDVAFGAVTGTIWFEVPKVVNVKFEGELLEGSEEKDLLFHLVDIFNERELAGMVVEYSGVDSFSMMERFTLANATIELGAIASVFPGDTICQKWFADNEMPSNSFYEADSDAEYDEVVEINLAEVEPLVRHNRGTVHPDEMDQVINQAILGFCGNDFFSDMKLAAEYLADKKVYPGVRFFIYPPSQRWLHEAIQKGYIDDLVQAGAILCPPSCGPCGNTHDGFSSDDDIVITNGNSNMYRTQEKTMILASTKTVLASLVAGRVKKMEA